MEEAEGDTVEETVVPLPPPSEPVGEGEGEKVPLPVMVVLRVLDAVTVPPGAVAVSEVEGVAEKVPLTVSLRVGVAGPLNEGVGVSVVKLLRVVLAEGEAESVPLRLGE